MSLVAAWPASASASSVRPGSALGLDPGASDPASGDPMPRGVLPGDTPPKRVLPGAPDPGPSSDWGWDQAPGAPPGSPPAKGDAEAGMAWLSAGSDIFAVDAADRTVRFRGCRVDTGRVADNSMQVRDGVATGRVKVHGATYAYSVPLDGSTRGSLMVERPGQRTETLTGPVIVNPQPDPLAGRQDLSPLSERLQRVVDSAPVEAGVSVRDLSGRFGFEEVDVNGMLRPKAASVIKLWILAELLRQVDCGQRSLDEGVLVRQSDVVDGTGELQHESFPQVVTLKRLVEYMIKFSDNTAANVIIDQLGGFAAVNSLIDSTNLKQTVLERKFLDTAAEARGEENYLSAEDVVSLLGAVWDGNILTEDSRVLMVEFMREQTINDKIPAALPPGVPVAHKTGELPDTSHDVGYFLIPGSELAVAFTTSGPKELGDETVRELARTVYDFLGEPTPDDELAPDGHGPHADGPHADDPRAPRAPRPHGPGVPHPQAPYDAPQHVDGRA